MGRKRLNHHADAIIGMLTGHHMVGQAEYFRKYGLGLYQYDYRTGILLFNGQAIHTFPIFELIREWFENEIRTFNIDPNSFRRTMVHVNLKEVVYLDAVTMKKWWIFKVYPKVKVEAFKAHYSVDFETIGRTYSKQSAGIIE